MPAGQLAQLIDRLAKLPGHRLDLLDDVRWPVAVEPFPEPADRECEGHQPLLGAVVQLAFDPASFGVARLHDPRPLEARAQWDGAGPHSAVKVPDRDVVLTTDEVYGSSLGGGCPWGWVRLIDVGDETAPSVLSEYRVPPYNDASECATINYERDANASFSSHNPTVTEHLAFVTRHSAGLQAIDTGDPTGPSAVAEFLPDPLADVTTEDPALSSGADKVVMWSYPIIRNGLIYVVDVRNGLYVLRYRGPFEEEVDSIRFLERNSNLGDATGTDAGTA